MANGKRKAKSTHSDLKHFNALRPYIAKAAKGRLGRHHLFSLCVKASLSKCFEFNMAARANSKYGDLFFAVSSLRGICEDLIVLRFIKGLPSSDRSRLISALSNHETCSRISLQDKFFSAVRPQQPVLRIKDADQQIALAETAARAIWNRHGWSNLKSGALPQIRQIAEKQGVPTLLNLYDYLYRLTSAGVHFSVQSLLRSGWGANQREFYFSTKNFRQYYTLYCTVYGAFMLCLYFEFFGSVLRPGPRVTDIVNTIRQDLLYTPRWPEMVTFDEMNLKAPHEGSVAQMIMSAFQAVTRKRLISRSVDYTNKSKSETRLVRAAFKALASAEASAKSK
jgi:hypothetical protein